MLTVYDIHSKDFKQSFRGYNMDEVNAFLDEVIETMDYLTKEKENLEKQVEELQEELDRVMEGEDMFDPQQTQVQQPLQQTGRFPAPQEQTAPSSASLSSMEQSIHKSIRVAQEVAEEVRLNAKKEAELIVQEAEKNADRIINEALQKARALHSEMVDLKQKATIYRARFRTLVQSHLDILDNTDWESLEEMEGDLEERGQQLEQFVQQDNEDDFMMDQLQTDYAPVEEPVGMEEVAATNFLEEEEQQPRRELRRTSRKLKKKAMF